MQTALGMIIFAYLCWLSFECDTDLPFGETTRPRQHGSGNPGATNVLRVGGKAAAAGVLICDVLKG